MLAALRPQEPDPEPIQEAAVPPVDPAFEVPKQTRVLTKQDQDLMREAEALRAALHEEERELARANFWYFITHVLFPDTWEQNYTEEFHKPIADEIQSLAQGEDIWIFLQREARKSFLFDLAANAWRIVRDPNIRLLLIGARKETVIPFARMMRSIFDEGTPGYEKFRETFPEFIFHGRGAALKQAFQFTVPNRTSSLPDPTFRAAYLGVTGAGWRCDVLTFDDAVERRAVFTPEGSLKALGQMLDLLPLVSKTSAYQNIIGLGTRWAYHDPYGRIIGENEDMEGAEEAWERFKSRRTRIIIRHAIEDPTTLCTHCPAHITLAYPHGNPVPPEGGEGEVTLAPIHSREGLLDTLNRYRTDQTKGESLWWHQYQNVCLAPANQKFKEEWFTLVIDRPTWPVPKKRVLAIDSADKDFQKKGLGDYMVAHFGDWDDIGRLCLKHTLRSNKWTREQFIQRILAYCQGTGWWPNLIIKEKFGEDNFLSEIGKVFREAYHPAHLHAVTRPAYAGTVMKKLDWIVEVLQSPMEKGLVVFGSAYPSELRARLSYEGTSLGQASHEDALDALSLFFSPGVRPNVLNRPLAMGGAWSPPPLQLYEPDHQQAQAPPMQQNSGLKTPRLNIAVDELGFSQVTWDPSSPVQHLRFDE